MADVHRVYEIQTDSYKVRVSGESEIYGFTGPRSEKDSYAKARMLIGLEQKKDPRSALIDHAKPT